MAKNLKLNIKNTQLAQALKIKEPPIKKVKKEKVEKVEEEAPKKLKARILPPVEKIIPKEIEKEKLEETKVEEKEEVKAKKTKAKKEIKEEIVQEKLETAPKEIKEEILTSKEVQKVKEVLPSEAVKEEKKLEEEKVEKAKEKPKKEKVVVEEKPLSKEFKFKKQEAFKTFDSRARHGLIEEQDERWRKKRSQYKVQKEEIPIIRPKNLSIKLPISLKDLASNMKIKASELITKLFSQGIMVTLNDYLDDETTIQLLGHDFGCEITIDRSKEEKIQVTGKTLKKEIEATPFEKLNFRAPIVTFMGHVDHGKTSIIDAIRKSNVAAQEAGAITQHIGAFLAKTSLGEITILDTPGHEAFFEMRARGANVTDIIILVIAGDEGIREQTVEAINQAKAAKVPIIVAINKSDKQSFDPEKVYRQLADYELTPEAWGGTTITVNCSALTKKGIPDLLEMISLQAEILELKADPSARARGTILESKMHKGLGAVATVLVQNGTLHLNDAFVFGNNWGKVKNMYDQNGAVLTEAGPSTPVQITGLSDLSEAGCEMIVVSDEKEAKEISKERTENSVRIKLRQAKKASLESMQKRQEKKVLPLIVRADVQGSIEALLTALNKIQSQKIDLNIISAEVGEISESDIELANTSGAAIIGFHTRVEPHADSLIKQLNVKVRLHDIIYHALDDVKELMKEKLDKIVQENDTGSAEIRTIFKSSQLGKIAGCIVIDGIIKRGQNARLIRNKEIIWKGKIASLKRVKEDVREVSKGVECGIVLENFSDILEKDIIQAFDITYLTQEI